MLRPDSRTASSRAPVVASASWAKASKSRLFLGSVLLPLVITLLGGVSLSAVPCLCDLHLHFGPWPRLPARTPLNCVGPGPDAAFNTIGGNDRLFFQPGSNLPAGNTAGGADDDLAVVLWWNHKSVCAGTRPMATLLPANDVITVYGGHFLDEVQGNHLTDLIVLFGGTLDSTAETGDGVGDMACYVSTAPDGSGIVDESTTASVNPTIYLRSGSIGEVESELASRTTPSSSIRSIPRLDSRAFRSTLPAVRHLARAGLNALLSSGPSNPNPNHLLTVH